MLSNDQVETVKASAVQRLKEIKQRLVASVLEVSEVSPRSGLGSEVDGGTGPRSGGATTARSGWSELSGRVAHEGE
jgi:hypothetical protein